MYNHLIIKLTQIFRGHWTNPDIRLATRQVIIPLLKISISALVIPLALGYTSHHIRSWLGKELSQDEILSTYLAAYPISLTSVSAVVGVIFARKAIDKWRDSVRDEIYLRGEVLHNLEEAERDRT
jgi:E3 ubiquitin-protein ligase MARCH6